MCVCVCVCVFVCVCVHSYMCVCVFVCWWGVGMLDLCYCNYTYRSQCLIVNATEFTKQLIYA